MVSSLDHHRIPSFPGLLAHFLVVLLLVLGLGKKRRGLSFQHTGPRFVTAGGKCCVSFILCCSTGDETQIQKNGGYSVHTTHRATQPLQFQILSCGCRQVWRYKHQRYWTKLLKMFGCFHWTNVVPFLESQTIPGHDLFLSAVIGLSVDLFLAQTDRAEYSTDWTLPLRVARS